MPNIIRGGGARGEFKLASGTYSYNSGSRTITISGLAFRPNEILIYPAGTSGMDTNEVLRFIFDSSGARVLASERAISFRPQMDGSDEDGYSPNLYWDTPNTNRFSSASATANGATLVFSAANQVGF